MSWKRQAVVVMAVGVIVMFTNLGGPRLWDRDEPRNAGCASEMMERGDWVTPVFNNELRPHKPVLLYWLMMTAYSVFGVNEFSARFWSAALAVGTAVCTCAIGRRLFGGSVGLWAGLIVSTSVMFAVAGRAATPDATLIFFSTLALTAFVYGAFGAPQPDGEGFARPSWRHPGEYFPRQWTIALAIYAAMGLAVLTKGPVGLVLPTAVIGMFLLIMRLPQDGADTVSAAARWPVVAAFLRAIRQLASPFAPLHFLRTCWSMRPLTALAIALAVALPWYLWVGIRTDGEFLRCFFIEQHFGRATHALEGHSGSLLYYPMAILVGFFPWSILLVPVTLETAAGLRRGDPRRVGYIFALCWIGVYVGAFSLARTKLPSYVTPCYPALALLAGGFVQRWVAGAVQSWLLWRRLAFVSLAVIGVILMIALPIAANRYLPGEHWLAALGLLPTTGGLLCLLLMERGRARWSAVTLAVTATLFVTALFGGVADRVSRHQQNHVLLAKVAQQDGHTQIAAFGLLEPTWVFYGDRPIHELHVSGDAVSMGQWIEVDGRWQRKSPLGVDDLAADSDSLIITTDRHLQHLESLLSSEIEVLADVPYFLKKDRLLLLRPRPTSPQTARQDDGPLRR